jgi:hypothetical protein
MDAGRRTLFTDILARLQELPNYTWDTDVAPFHSVRSPCRSVHMHSQLARAQAPRFVHCVSCCYSTCNVHPCLARTKS